MIACLMVIALEPTEVPIELATSFAPKLQATYKAKQQTKIRNSIDSELIIDNCEYICGLILL
jgi:hypothetical protein